MEGATSVGSILFFQNIDSDNKSVIITSEQIATDAEEIQFTNFKPIEQKHNTKVRFNEHSYILWCPIKMRIFHLNESCLTAAIFPP